MLLWENRLLLVLGKGVVLVVAGVIGLVDLVGRVDLVVVAVLVAASKPPISLHTPPSTNPHPTFSPFFQLFALVALFRSLFFTKCWPVLWFL